MARSAATAKQAEDKASKRSTAKPGKRSSVEKVSRLLKTPARIMGPRLLFIFCVVALCCLGLVMIYSASSIVAYSSSDFGNDPTYFVKKQAIFLGIGLILCIIAAAVPHNFWCHPVVAGVLWGMTTLLLVAVVAGLGRSELGAERALTIAGFSIQPSEFAKISVLLVMAMLLQRQKMGYFTSRQYYGAVAVVGLITIFLIYKQPDLGTAIIMLVGVIALLWLGGLRWYVIAGIVVLGILYVAFVCIVQPYHITRIMTMFNPWADAQGDGYQSVQSLLAFGSGGVFGTGLGLSRQKYNYLPYAYNDFIYAVVGEELGLIGALIVLLLFCALIFAGIRIARTAPDIMGAALAGSLTTMIGFQAMVNMACVVGIAPVTGKALPFLSYGGSSIIATMAMVGLVLSVSFRSKMDIRNEKRRDDLMVLEGGKNRSDNRERGSGRKGQAAATGSSPTLDGLRKRFSKPEQAASSSRGRGTGAKTNSGRNASGRGGSARTNSGKTSSGRAGSTRANSSRNGAGRGSSRNASARGANATKGRVGSMADRAYTPASSVSRKRKASGGTSASRGAGAGRSTNASRARNAGSQGRRNGGNASKGRLNYSGANRNNSSNQSRKRGR